MTLISLKNVTMSYEGKRVISELSFDINSGDYLAIVGENGSGKTTLLKGLLGLKKLDGGKIEYSDKLSSKEIGYLPQQNEFQRDFPASVKEVVLSGRINSCGMRPFYSRKDKQIAAKAMERLDISDLKNRCYHELSGGQQQKVLLARAICASKKLLILDEPVTGLDMASSEEMYNVIKSLNDEGVTVIMISHDVERIAASAKTVLHIGEQKVLFYGNSSEYITTARSGGFWEKNNG